MGVVTSVTESAFKQTAEQVYDYVSNPGNWPSAYPGSTDEEGLPKHFPLKVGDIWVETGPRGERYTWQVTIAVRPHTWGCTTIGPIGHDREGKGGVEGRINIHYRFLRPGHGVTVFQRTMSVETYKESPMPDSVFASMNPTQPEKYFAAIAKALGS